MTFENPTLTERLLIREIGNAWAEIGGVRGPLRGRIPDVDIRALANTVYRALPAEVLVGSGGCGGEHIVAVLPELGEQLAVDLVNRYFKGDDSLWPLLTRVPLITRAEQVDDEAVKDALFIQKLKGDHRVREP